MKMEAKSYLRIFFNPNHRSLRQITFAPNRKLQWNEIRVSSLLLSHFLIMTVLKGGGFVAMSHRGPN